MIAIKGISIPNDCFQCSFQTNDGSCLAHIAKNDTSNYWKCRPIWCPLVELDHPDFSNSYVDPDSYVRVGDIMDCLSEVLCPDNELIHIEGLFEWAMGKRAMSKNELFEYLYRDFEEREVLDE